MIRSARRPWWLLALMLSAAGCATVAPASVSQSIKPGDPVPGPHYILWSEHRSGSGTGDLWWRAELGPVTREACRAALKHATSRPRVGFTKWYDVTPARLHEVFGSVATPDYGTWLACWPEGYVYGEPDR